jgi:hypothetical protein
MEMRGEWGQRENNGGDEPNQGKCHSETPVNYNILIKMFKNKKKKGSKKMVVGAVAHICNSSYSGGRDQEEHDLKPA